MILSGALLVATNEVIDQPVARRAASAELLVLRTQQCYDQLFTWSGYAVSLRWSVISIEPDSQEEAEWQGHARHRRAICIMPPLVVSETW